MNLVYSCVFFQESYLNLIELLLKSYKLYGNIDENETKYLIICNKEFENKVIKIFNNLNIDGYTWCLDLNTKFEAGYSRLFIFDYPDINKYDKILYLDCDILVTNELSNMFNIELDEKIYVLEEGNTNHPFWGNTLFENNPNESAFTSGIILFKNSEKIKKLFLDILEHIKKHIEDKKEIPECLDQPFIIYHAFKNRIFDNQTLKKKVINNPDKYNYETISHFCGIPGHYESKIEKMKNYMNNIMMNKIKFDTIEMDDYKKLLNENKFLFNKLNEICLEIGEPVEGNCFYEHLNINNKINELIYKQMNHVSLGRISNNIMEIGFNAGHSSLLYLLSNPKNKITIFDLCEHKYTLPCFNFLCEIFPGRLRIFPGDSTKTIPEFINNNKNEFFDLIHIDGCHITDIANKDFFNSLKLASSIMIWDDTQIFDLNVLFNNYLINGYINEIILHKTMVYEHRVCIKNKLLNKEFTWGDSVIKFLSNGKMNAFGNGNYFYLRRNLIKANFGDKEHLILFDNDFTNYISIRKHDFEVVKGTLKKEIPKIIFQTSINKPENYIIETINKYCPDYKYIHFIDNEIIKYFEENPLDEFKNIIHVFNSFSKGQHKADLFRYYYLYINGGIFLDSDAIFETNINNIIKKYDTVFIKSFMPNICIFNGFIATYPKNPVIYEALKHTYNTNNNQLLVSYHYLCEELWSIYNRLNLQNTKIYQEINKEVEGYGGSIIVDDDNNKIISHYFRTKKIPNNLEVSLTQLSNQSISEDNNLKNMTNEFSKIYKTNFWINGSGTGSYIENTKVYNDFIVEFINKNNIKQVTDIGCGDWQSSYLIYNKLENIDYLGIDCVQTVIENNINNHPKYSFQCLNILEDLGKIRDSEVYIIKDVLQHWKLSYIYKLLDFLTTSKNFKYIIITNNGMQYHDDLELDVYLGVGRGLHSKFLPLKKYNAVELLNYYGGEPKHMCYIQKK